ncbi:hypothetical protein N7465_004897 [Penicillium sp. CMV-2018d]|nr:hypothetical protein N7465_004897 [Penicillium sp. CMV-2018d]
MSSSCRRNTKSSKPHGKEQIKHSLGSLPWKDWSVLPCQREDAVFHKWSLVRDTILKRLDLRLVDTIGCYRVGTSYNPRRTYPTILIFGDHANHPNTIEKSLEIVNEILETLDLSDVRVEFIEDQTSWCADDDEAQETGVFDRRVIQSPSMPGQSLSLEENSKSSGTLGGFFELKLPGSQEPKVVAVTCFHVLNPTEKGKTAATKTRIRRWRKEGILPDDQETSDLTVYHPSPRAIQEKAGALKKQVADIQSPRYILWDELASNDQPLRKGDRMMYEGDKQQLLNCKTFIQDLKDFDPGFGRVWAASGSRTRKALTIQSGRHKEPTCCDWALIEIPDERLSSNTTPDGHVLKRSPVPTNFDNVRLCLWGQKSGYSEGDYYSLQDAKVKHQIIEGQEVSIATIEHTVIGSGTQFPFFAKPGDSGSLVFTKDSHVVVGMLFAGNKRTSNFTHIDDLIADIKDVTGATQVRLR